MVSWFEQMVCLEEKGEKTEGKREEGEERERETLFLGTLLLTFCLANPSSLSLNVTSLVKFSLFPSPRQS